jgi:hypothetical protein
MSLPVPVNHVSQIHQGNEQNDNTHNYASIIQQFCFFQLIHHAGEQFTLFFSIHRHTPSCTSIDTKIFLIIGNVALPIVFVTTSPVHRGASQFVLHSQLFVPRKNLLPHFVSAVYVAVCPAVHHKPCQRYLIQG